MRASNVNTTIPVFGNPTTESVRDNFSIIKMELEALDVEFDNYVLKAGDLVTGPLLLGFDATADNQAVHKKYVDDAIAAGGGGGGGGGITEGEADLRYLRLIGGSVTGPITLPGAPILALHAATMAYADTKLATADADIRFADLQGQIDILSSNLLFSGIIDVSTDAGTYTLASGMPNGPLPAPSAANRSFYVIVATGGSPPNGSNIPANNYAQGDWIISAETQWVHLSAGATAVTASMVELVPPVDGNADVQAAIEDLSATRLTEAQGDARYLRSGGLIVLPAGAQPTLQWVDVNYGISRLGTALRFHVGSPTAPRFTITDGAASFTGLEVQGVGEPQLDSSAATKRYVDSLGGNLGAYHGHWQVALNDPDLIDAIATNNPGDYWIAETVGQLPEQAPPGIPGIAGQTINHGQHIGWSEANDAYVVAENQITSYLNANYLRLIGGRLSGPLTTSSYIVTDGDVHFHADCRIDRNLFVNQPGSFIVTNSLTAEAGISLGATGNIRLAGPVGFGHITSDNGNLHIGGTGRVVGQLFLEQLATANDHATNKQYVDGAVGPLAARVAALEARLATLEAS